MSAGRGVGKAAILRRWSRRLAVQAEASVPPTRDAMETAPARRRDGFTRAELAVATAIVVVVAAVALPNVVAARTSLGDVFHLLRNSGVSQRVKGQVSAIAHHSSASVDGRCQGSRTIHRGA
jgi:hypothetical protein